MKNVLKSLVVLALLVGQAMSVMAAPTTIKKNKISSYIKEVTVFSDRALVVRQATVNLVPGERTIKFSKLTGSLDPNTVQIKGRGHALIKGVKVSQVYLDELEDQDIVALKNQLDKVQNKIEMTTDKLGHAKQEKKFVESITKRLTTATNKSERAEFDPQKWIAMVTFYRTKLDQLDKEVRLGNSALKPLQEKKRQLNQELQTLRGRNQHSRYEVSVVLDAKQEGKSTLELSYVVSGPSWQPKYDVRADSKRAKVQVAYHANIRQNTGEDWRRAKIILSTAQPKAGDSHPKLQPWRVTQYQPRPKPSRQAYKKRARRSAYGQAAAMPAMEADSASLSRNEAPPAPMPVMQAQAKQTGTAVHFDIKGKYTIKSDNQPHQVTIMIQSFPATFNYSAVPKLVKHAYLKAEITNKTDFPLLAGETNIFLDNNFVTTGHIETIAPEETFWAALGIDEGIKVEHQLINRELANQGVFGGRKQVNFDYLITVTSYKKKAIDIIVQDQLPLPAHRDIQVELKSPVYKDNDKSFTKSKDQLLEWHHTIKAGGKIKTPLKFTVSYPEKMKIQGL